MKKNWIKSYSEIIIPCTHHVILINHHDFLYITELKILLFCMMFVNVFYIRLTSILYCKCLLLLFIWRLQHGHRTLSQFMKIAQVRQYFWPLAYRDPPFDFVALYWMQRLMHAMMPIWDLVQIWIIKVSTYVDPCKKLSRSP